MSRESIQQLMAEFEGAKLIDQGEECWSARELASLLGYRDWDSFQNVIRKAIDACVNAGGERDRHFQEGTPIGEAGSFGRGPADFRLTRWGAYLVAMNGDPRKERIAFAQVYFVARTQQAEVIEQKLLLHDRVAARRELAMSEADFSKAMAEIGLSGDQMGRIRTSGDRVLFGGRSTEDMKREYGMVDMKGRVVKSALADRLPTFVQRGKAFAASLTKQKIHDGARGEMRITKHHNEHNAGVREVMVEAGYIPENLAPEEDTKKLERSLERERNEALKAVGARKQLSMQAPKSAVADSDIPSSDGGQQLALPFED